MMDFAKNWFASFAASFAALGLVFGTTLAAIFAVGGPVPATAKIFFVVDSFLAAVLALVFAVDEL